MMMLRGGDVAAAGGAGGRVIYTEHDPLFTVLTAVHTVLIMMGDGTNKNNNLY